jgi:poly-gamma-glutamate capsule biosynthesis protein CapA/YwtB (metallophosphatase superfamily)
MAKITIAAVGDILMKGKVIVSAKQAGKDRYSFGPIFKQVMPYLKEPNITVGNLEITFSGKPVCGQYERRNRKTNYPMFNCPDQLAADLLQTGFTVLTTANNHCMDGGAAGLKRTLRILDKNSLRHTGTFRSREESRRLLFLTAMGIKVGIAAYTFSTNRIPVPEPWMVNRTIDRQIAADIAKLRKKADFVMICLHFGHEYHLLPNQRQKQLVQLCFKEGAHAVIGAHPHVLQPVIFKKVRDKYGKVKNRVAAYSLGNFISSKLMNNPRSLHGMILQLIVTKSRSGETDISMIRKIPTIVRVTKNGDRRSFRIVKLKN